MPEKPTNAAEYLAALTDAQRAAMEQLRLAILEVAPDAEEAFSYGIPAFRLHGKPLVWYAAWKAHYSLYPLSAAMLREHAQAIVGYPTAKGTIRFPAKQPLPLGLVQALVRSRVGELRNLDPAS
jgi:uncharacterized protein YdhG (YjbR/CyaY superfamily)